MAMVPINVSILLILTSLLVFSIIPPSSSTTADGDALLQIIAQWKLDKPANWTGSDPCTANWEGVQCQDSRVSALNFSNKGLVGPIPKEISSLDALVSLDLSNSKTNSGPWNLVIGDLSAISSLTHLKSLNLSFNELNVTFPEVVLELTALTELRIDNAGLIGTFPQDLSTLKNLQYLYLANNSMTGPMPSSLGSLANLIELSLWGIQFDSEIPTEISTLSHLTYLTLHDCQLYGGVPSEFQNLKNLQRLYLYSNDLTGPIPESWANMNSLQDLRLQHNYLTKDFPSWIENSTSLTSVDISYNELFGTVSNITNSNLKKLNIACNYFTGLQANSLSTNTNLTESQNCFEDGPQLDYRTVCQHVYTCSEFNKKVVAASQCPSCPVGQLLSNSSSCVCSKDTSQAASETKSKSGVIIGVVVGAAAVIIVGVLGLLAFKRYGYFQKKDSTKTWTSKFQDRFDAKGPVEYWEAPKGVERFSLDDLEKATSGFNSDHQIGVGGFGKVFYGVLENGKEVAIKCATASSMQGGAEFRNEVMLLSRLHHRNLVRLEGFCEDMDLQILVYEYVANGNLHKHLFQNTGTSSFGWLRRLDIAVGIAQGLDYLHSFADPPVIHRDVKPSNILLDNNMVAKVADFGISKATMEFETHISTTPAGTAGYIDPQYFLRRQLTTASDVYGFGVVLLELVTGQKAIDHNRLEDHNLIEWVKLRMKVDGLNGIIDSRIAKDCPLHIYHDVTDLAIRCAAFNKNERPNMKEVVTTLDSCLRAACPLPSKVLSLDLSHDQASTIDILADDEFNFNTRAVEEDQGPHSNEATTSYTAFKGALIMPR